MNSTQAPNSLPQTLRIERMTDAAARTIARWRYDEPYTVYSFEPGDADWLLLERNHYHAITSEALAIVGFFCVGSDARVPGIDYWQDALDIGLGLRPDLTGQGLSRLVLAAILDYCRERYAPALFRLTVAAFNRRAVRAYERAGFRVRSSHIIPQGEFLQMVRPVLVGEEEPR